MKDVLSSRHVPFNLSPCVSLAIEPDKPLRERCLEKSRRSQQPASTCSSPSTLRRKIVQSEVNQSVRHLLPFAEQPKIVKTAISSRVSMSHKGRSVHLPQLGHFHARNRSVDVEAILPPNLSLDFRFKPIYALFSFLCFCQPSMILFKKLMLSQPISPGGRERQLLPFYNCWAMM